MKIGSLHKLGLVLVFGYVFSQTNFLWGDTSASVKQNIDSTSSLRQADQGAASGVRNNTLSTTEKLCLLVLGISGACLGLSMLFSTKRAPQTKAPVAPLPRTSCPLPCQVPRSWSEDIVPLKLKPSKETGELVSRGT